jgi:CDP-4-dehydro-6-deoxyglucose reductase
MQYDYYEAEVINIIDETPLVKRFIFKMPDTIRFDFKPGQFVMIDLPISAKLTNRSFTIASAPSDDNIFELCIVRKEDGIGTHWIWDHVRIGTKLRCTNALGKFVLPETIETDLCFIATGTGIAPFRSMIHHIYNRKITHKQIYLIFGNRHEIDILYRHEFETLQESHPEFHFIPVLSRETPDTWKGELGYVHPVYQKIFKGQKNVLFFLCGWHIIIKEIRENLKSMGFGRQEIKFELYD